MEAQNPRPWSGQPDASHQWSNARRRVSNTSTVSPELIELRKVEAQIQAIAKWDGHLPNVSSGAVPFIQIQPQTNSH